MKNKHLILSVAFLFSCSVQAHVNEHANEKAHQQKSNEHRQGRSHKHRDHDQETASADTFGWEIIPVPPILTVTDKDGNLKTIEPACAFDEITIPGVGAVPNPFYFYFKPGKKDKLVVYFNGGGACWDDATCIASLVKGERPVYNPTIHQDNTPEGVGGIFDDANEDNPFKDWSKVFIPYCSGDLHVGSKEVTYFDDVDGSVTGFPFAPVPVMHHGFDNFLAVKEWLKGQFSTEEHGKPNKLEKLLITGSSAGGYGATLNFPYLQDAFPKTDAVLFADASEAIVTQGFLDSTFSVGGSWNLENTLPAIIADDLGSYAEETFNEDIFGILTASYPDSRFAQYTTVTDVVQIQFLKIMSSLDQGDLDPESWRLTLADIFAPGSFGELWVSRMIFSLEGLSQSTDNYQYYIGAGTIHTILTNDFATAEIPNPFYDEASAGVPFVEWMDSLVNDKKFNEESVKTGN